MLAYCILLNSKSICSCCLRNIFRLEKGLSNCPSNIYLSFCLSIYIYFYLSLCLSIYQSFYLSMYHRPFPLSVKNTPVILTWRKCIQFLVAVLASKLYEVAQSDQEVFLRSIFFIVYYTSVSPKKYFAKNLELWRPINLLFVTALTVPKLRFGGFYCRFGKYFYIPSDHIFCPTHSGSIVINLGKTHFLIPAQYYVPADHFLIPAHHFIFRTHWSIIYNKSIGTYSTNSNLYLKLNFGKTLHSKRERELYTFWKVCKNVLKSRGRYSRNLA